MKIPHSKNFFSDFGLFFSYSGGLLPLVENLKVVG